jgi:hypothetical protein
MSRWDDERRQMILHSIFIANNPLAYLFGMWLLGMLGGIYLWLAPVKKTTPEPKQLKTAIDYALWGYQVMNRDMPGIMQGNPGRRKANCKEALPYFKKAISLDSKLGLGYQGQGMSLICQDNKLSGRKSLKHAKSLHLQQGKKRDVEEIDFILGVYN